MKQKMTENTNVMKQKMTENTNVMKQKMTENTNVMKQRMTESTNVVKQRVTENTNEMTQKMNESTVNMRNLLTGKTSPSKNKLSLWNIGKKKSHDEAEAKAAAATPEDTDTMDIDSLLSESFNFTIDGDDDVAASSSKPALPASEPSGYVALSFDDAPCRFNDRGHSQMENVLDLLDKYDAKATFMVISSFLENSHEADMIRLLKEGHELANHGVRDEAMDKMATSVDVFLEALDECNTKITDLQKKADVSDIGVKWFRAPQSRYTKTMEEGLVARDMHNVMCDAYAACPIVEDGPWIASALSKQIRNGSIALLHMPEKMGFREHCLEALELLLEDLCKKRNFKVVTVGELQKLADEVAASKAKESGKAPEESKEDGEIEFL
jgi:peptidoglycan/xylan/chitin deacetylase (PgdA/CDA1 family)